LYTSFTARQILPRAFGFGTMGYKITVQKRVCTMNHIQAFAILISLTGLLAYLNRRLLSTPLSIGLMFMSLICALTVVLLELAGAPLAHEAQRMIRMIDFEKLLMQGMLGLMLFAGALHVNLNDLLDNGIEIGIFATVGVLVSSLLIGLAAFGICQVLGFSPRFIDCMVLGALISPTDPIAVMGILQKAGAPKRLAAKMSGESQFNDGIGVVIFMIMLEMSGGGELSMGHAAYLFITEAVGGVAFGLLLGGVGYLMLKGIDEYKAEILITLGLAMGGYTLAAALHVSAPIAAVVAGLFIGNEGKRLAMSHTTVEHLTMFWELVDQVLNALLFVMIGLEVLVLGFEGEYWLAGLLLIPLALLSRYISLSMPVGIMKRWRPYAPGAVPIMTWGGLRGGISVALALSLPAGPYRELFLSMTYAVVVFSILVQGLTLKHLVRHFGGTDNA
jgi:CPA1 family monovalent cation:H+ antiporter